MHKQFYLCGRLSQMPTGHLVRPALSYEWAIALTLSHAGMTVLVTVMLSTKEETHLMGDQSMLSEVVR
jgi:hypothetical protein